MYLKFYVPKCKTNSKQLILDENIKLPWYIISIARFSKNHHMVWVWHSAMAPIAFENFPSIKGSIFCSRRQLDWNTPIFITPNDKTKVRAKHWSKRIDQQKFASDTRCLNLNRPFSDLPHENLLYYSLKIFTDTTRFFLRHSIKILVVPSQFIACLRIIHSMSFKINIIIHIKNNMKYINKGILIRITRLCISIKSYKHDLARSLRLKKKKTNIHLEES